MRSLSTDNRRVFAAAALLALLVVIGLRVAGEAASAAARDSPNFVVIQTDDQTLNELRATWITPLGNRARVMPNTLDLIRRRGISFNRYNVSYPLCCPSRSSLLSGRYAHSNGVISNSAPKGGWVGYQKKAIYKHNLGVWLQRAGYRTIHLGKFLNGYGGPGPDDPETKVPPGWDEWQTDATDNSTRLYYGYLLNHDGTIEGPFGDRNYNATSGKDDPGCPLAPPLLGTCDYQEDVLSERAVRQINQWSAGGPFYLQLDYNAPHGDSAPPIGPEPAARHYDSARDTPLPKPPGFNEGDVSDKPSFIRDDADLLQPENIRRIRTEYQKSLESLRSVDEGVKRVIDALRRSGELSNTYVFFISDNGFFFGEHRLERSKFLPYEPAIHLPLLVRGPGIGADSRSGELAANIDLAPTIVELAGARADRSFDGRSLVPYWTDTSRRSRTPLLLESFAKATDITPPPVPRQRTRRGASTSISAPVENYLGVRLGPYKYVEYETGDRELYDLAKDPYELNNRVRDPRFDRVQAFLKRQINRLEGCVGKECRFTTGPLPKPGVPAKPGPPVPRD
jgi:N-acetylglucosamine-6-sulfatase